MTEPLIRVISFGAGVQSTAMLLMALDGHITPMPDCAIHADIGWESKETVSHLHWMLSHCFEREFKIHITSVGNIRNEADGIKARGCGFTASLPMYVVKNGKPLGPSRRQCTRTYKIDPIVRKIREMVGPYRKNRIAEQWIGFSAEEKKRIGKPRRKWLVERYPLIELYRARHGPGRLQAVA